MNLFKPKETSSTRLSFLTDQGDLFTNFKDMKESSLFLGKYTLREAGKVLKKKSFTKEAKKRGLQPIDVVVDSSEFPPLQRLQMFYKGIKPENLVVDLKIKESFFSPQTKLIFDFSPPELSLLVLEWLTLQNPRLKFSQEKGPLPGQQYPGLNLGKKIMDLFEYLARLNKNDGILAFPAYFHNALLFSRNFHFINPEKEAEILAIRKTFKEVSFKQLAWIIHWNCLRDKKNRVYEWRAEEQVFPLRKDLQTYFKSRAYKTAVLKTLRKLSYRIDWVCLRHKKKSINLDRV